MCSNRCAKPVRPGFSFFDPTWNHWFTCTIGSLRSTCRMTCRPFGSVYFSNSSFGMAAWTPCGVWPGQAGPERHQGQHDDKQSAQGAHSSLDSRNRGVENRNRPAAERRPLDCRRSRCVPVCRARLIGWDEPWDESVLASVSWACRIEGMSRPAAFILSLTLLISLPGTPAAQQAAVPVSGTSSVSATRVRADVEFLADDLLEGREAATRGYELAARYAAAALKSAGYAPGADDGSYLQQVPFSKARRRRRDAPDH